MVDVYPERVGGRLIDVRLFARRWMSAALRGSNPICAVTQAIDAEVPVQRSHANANLQQTAQCSGLLEAFVQGRRPFANRFRWP